MTYLTSLFNSVGMPPPPDRRSLMATYVVTGCAGFIGSHLSEQLLDSVVGIDSFTPYYARCLKEHNLGGLRTRSGFRMFEGL